MNKPLVSVIIPAYNPDNYIFRAIDSVLNQTYKNIEIIVVDDGSKKVNVEKLLDNYIQNNKIIFHKKENWWPWSARNFWVEKSNWEYIAFLDDDDEYLPEKIEKQIEAVKNWYNIILTNWYVKYLNWNKIDYIREKEININNVIKSKSFFCIQSILLKKDIYENIKIDENLNYWEDRLFLLEIVNSHKNIYNIPKFMVNIKNKFRK